MCRRPKFWLITKWAGLVIAGLILGGWITNLFIHGTIKLNHELYVSIGGGSLYLNTGWNALLDRIHGFREYPTGSSIVNRFIGSWRFSSGPFNLQPDGHFIGIPFWLPFLIAFLPTAVLFWHNRKRPVPGLCKHCGYNLEGNLSGICPECGEPVNVQAATPAESAPQSGDEHPA